jgi:hypothetical protein
MVTVDMVWTPVNSSNDKRHFRESFNNAADALSYVVGYIGAFPMTVIEMEMEL